MKILKPYNNIEEDSKMYLLELTEEELEFLYERCQRKAMRLEEAHLEDIPCYTLSNRIMWKIHDLKKIKEKET